MDGTEQLLAYNGAPEVTANYREGGWNLGGVNSEGTPVAATINAQAFLDNRVRWTLWFC